MSRAVRAVGAAAAVVVLAARVAVALALVLWITCVVLQIGALAAFDGTQALKYCLFLAPRLVVLGLVAFPYGRLVDGWRRRRGREVPPDAGRRRRRRVAWVVGLELAAFVALQELTAPSPIHFDPARFWRTAPRLANERGLRGPVVGYAKAPGLLRIVCIGDSVTYGYGTDRDEDTYPLVLERVLRERFPGRPLEVLNAGVVGYSSYQGYVWLRDEIVRYDPDLVITYFGLHEMLVPRVERLSDYDAHVPAPLEAAVLGHSQTLAFLAMTSWVHQRGYFGSYGERVAAMLLESYRFNLDRMEELGARDGFRVLEAIPMDLRDGQVRPVWPKPAWRADRLLDVGPAFERHADPPSLFVDWAHFSVAGNRLMAEQLADALAPALAAR